MFITFDTHSSEPDTRLTTTATLQHKAITQKSSAVSFRSMSSPPADNALPGGARLAAASKLASQRDATGPPQRMAVLMQQLDDLLLEAEEPYREAWTELKEGIAQLTAVSQIQVDNAHVAKLTRAVERLILS